MTTRKPKPTYSRLIELLTEQLQLAPVIVEHKTPSRAGQPWQAEAEPPVARPLADRGNNTLH
jgi:hypothetical protein